MFIDVRMCECIVCMKEKANKVKKREVQSPSSVEQVLRIHDQTSKLLDLGTLPTSSGTHRANVFSVTVTNMYRS